MQHFGCATEGQDALEEVSVVLEAILAATTGMLARVRFHRQRLRDAAADEMVAATDVADLLVRLGVPFREADGIVAGLVRTAMDAGKPLSELTPEELAAHSEILAAHEGEFYEVLAQGAWLESKASEGATSPDRVREQLDLARAALDHSAAR